MALCEYCACFKAHGEKCWFYWEQKKQCSQFKTALEHESEFREM